ncbi:toll/interleukin-1 receptor domain-containing protein [Vibrio alginolyticus]|uniref:toll/interleukin-1 receptor domain-containing protein n=1 Tax=Vibrio alginolyticus TaxID=663 RepID=UPI001592CC7D|nr:toll/interleukin-1 receptor domain-containing protein [Vibrio alginolyticus]QKS94354.1 toll/interleukin-1 receptor domain-containing protein [Vibrio alginolyticus]HCZ9033972.1 toll/interleukin-1 receptor domain-containing protein [Vibrio alginolyticus]HCZ9053033.1 toll/interleukin-1 receptor domain-containing protein [Vibrio alginolyticus]
MNVPKVFVSYSHDSIPHKNWVLSLATNLRAAGIDAILDQWELTAGDDLPLFMERHIANSDYILMICTDNYVVKANSGKGGVGYEKMIVTSDLMASIDSNKVIPIIRQKGANEVPIFLKTRLYINMSNDEVEEFGFDELIRTIHGSPLYKKPTLGKNPFESGEVPQPQKAVPASDSLKELMKNVIHEYNQTNQPYILYKNLLESATFSRIMLDFEIDKAVNKGLITKDSDGDVILTDVGRRYAVDNDLA